LLLLAGCSRNPETEIASALRKGSGIIELPAGTLVLRQALVVPDRAHDIEIRGSPKGSILRAAAGFRDKALITSKGATNLLLTGFRLEGNLTERTKRSGLPPSDVPFAKFYSDNGILIENAARVSIRNVSLARIANYALLISASSGVRIEGVQVEDSGSLTPEARNNASGGILLEEGTSDFEVRHCTIRRVRGNGIWTHSNYHSPRNANGIIAQNTIEEVARDAIQVGHATNVRVAGNTGTRIGYPAALVDMASYAVPVAIDTAGNVDKSIYAGNRFEDIDGQCIDLDGFHDGEVRDNSCISHGPYGDYPNAQYGIVFGNSNPEVEPVNVTISGNLIDGAGYGGIFLIGSRNLITGNRLLGLNRNRCTGDMTQPRCNYAPDQPALLHSGIYLGRGAARPADTVNNRITGNEISGFGIKGSCVVAAPGVSLARNQVADNRCTDSQAFR
jgi:parallel beta-helix repeat protein